MWSPSYNTDEDECVDKEARCGSNTVCYNTIGSYYCQCEPGYRAKLDQFTAVQGVKCKGQYVFNIHRFLFLY